MSNYLFDPGDSVLLGASAIPGMAYHRQSRQQQQHHHGSSGMLKGGSDARYFHPLLPCCVCLPVHKFLLSEACCREESYMLLLELSSQEPTIQSCFKVIESTCLARGIQLKIRGCQASKDFQRFLDRYYLPFAEHAIRHFFTLGFVPWRLRRLATGDCVPEAIPLGLFTWSIDSIPNRTSAGADAGAAATVAGRSRALQKRRSHQESIKRKMGQEKEQVAANRAFENQREYFANKKRHPYTLPPPSSSNHCIKIKQQEVDQEKEEEEEEADPKEEARNSKRARKAAVTANTPAFYRQQDALKRQDLQYRRGGGPADDEDTKMLR